MDEKGLDQVLASYLVTLSRRDAEYARKAVGTFFDAICNLKPGVIAGGSQLTAAAQVCVNRQDPKPPSDAGVPSVRPLLAALRAPVDLDNIPFGVLHDRTLVLVILHCLLRPKSVQQLLYGGDGYELSSDVFRFRTTGVKTRSSTEVTELAQARALSVDRSGLCLVRHAVAYDRRVAMPDRQFFFVRVSARGLPERGQPATGTISSRINRFLTRIDKSYKDATAKTVTKMSYSAMVDLGLDPAAVGAGRWHHNSQVAMTHYYSGALGAVTRKRALQQLSD